MTPELTPTMIDAMNRVHCPKCFARLGEPCRRSNGGPKPTCIDRVTNAAVLKRLQLIDLNKL